jgi:hypothetical protein
VNWKRICTPIELGGLVVQNLIQFNQALVGKWSWRYATERKLLWRRLVIAAEYESTRGGWSSKEVLGTYGVGVQKHTRRGWDKFSNFVHFEMGVGSKVSFRHDIWCGDSPLKLCYPALFSIA